MIFLSKTIYIILFKTVIFFAIIFVVKADIEESQITDGETTDVIETSSTNELEENGNDLLQSAFEWIGGILTNLLSTESIQETEGARTFGKIRRLQMAMIPLLFKFGVISAMITALLFLVLKVIFLLKALLVINLGGIFAKLIALKSPYQLQAPWPSYYQGLHHTSHIESRTYEPPTLNKEIHVHIHNSGQSSIGGDSTWNNEPYVAYSKYNPTSQIPTPAIIPFINQ